jgi:hypothetical protein
MTTRQPYDEALSVAAAILDTRAPRRVVRRGDSFAFLGRRVAVVVDLNMMADPPRYELGNEYDASEWEELTGSRDEEWRTFSSDLSRGQSAGRDHPEVEVHVPEGEVHVAPVYDATTERMRFLDPDQLPGSFDWAMPLEFYEVADRVFGTNSSGQIVWYYPPNCGAFGFPLAVTPLGARILGAMALRLSRTPLVAEASS